MDQREARLVELLEMLRAMFVDVGADGHPMLDQLLDPAERRSARTLNYLAATASGTLQDRIFCAGNHDPEPAGGFDAFNDRYRKLIDEAVELAHELGLPAARDFRK